MTLLDRLLRIDRPLVASVIAAPDDVHVSYDVIRLHVPAHHGYLDATATTRTRAREHVDGAGGS